MSEIRLKSTGTIKLFENDNTSSVTIASPASLGADRTVTLPDASVTLASGTMLATDGSGASLTALNASELGSGTVPTARLGSGTASSSTILYGDQTYKAEPTVGKILQVVQGVNAVSTATTSGTFSDFYSQAITPTAASSTILVLGRTCCGATAGGDDMKYTLRVQRDIESAGYSTIATSPYSIGYSYGASFGNHTQVTDQSICFLDSPSYTLTDVLTYKYQIACDSGGTATYNDGSTQSSLTLIEVAA